jgi:hypothetical protein
MPRPKSDLTKSGRAVGARLTEWEFQEWKKLGGIVWLRKLLLEGHKRRNHEQYKQDKSGV